MYEVMEHITAGYRPVDCCYIVCVMKSFSPSYVRAMADVRFDLCHP